MRDRYGRHARYSTWVSVTHGDHINFNLWSGGHHCASVVSATRHRPQNECLNYYKFDSAQPSQRLKNVQTAPTKIIFSNRHFTPIINFLYKVLNHNRYIILIPNIYFIVDILIFKNWKEASTLTENRSKVWDQRAKVNLWKSCFSKTLLSTMDAKK